MTLHDELRDLAQQLERVHRKQWTPTQWEVFKRLYLEHLEALTSEDLQVYERSMREWLKGAKAMAPARRRAGMA